MYNNSYFGNSQYPNSYYSPYGQVYGNGYQPQQMQQKQNQVQDIPFSIVRFGTLDEAKAHIVPPSKAIMFIKSDFSEFYIKSADNMGNPALETFKCTRLTENPIQIETSKFDPKEFVKSEDLKGFIKRDELSGFLTHDDLRGIATEIDKLKKRIEINEIAKGEIKNGKQG